VVGDGVVGGLGVRSVVVCRLAAWRVVDCRVVAVGVIVTTAVDVVLGGRDAFAVCRSVARASFDAGCVGRCCASARCVRVDGSVVCVAAAANVVV
jgi:hypothetical protein